MRYGVLSDVHANLHALERVVAALEWHGVDAYLCTGDLVGYGPHPNECIALVERLGALCVAGNHDLIAVGALDQDRAGQLARQSLGWTRQVLRPEARAFLEGLPRTRTVEGWLLAHGSPDDPQEYVRTPERAGELLRAAGAAAPRGIVLGHTHHQWAVAEHDGELLRRRTGRLALRPDRRHLLNAGSVGQSRDGDTQARFLVLDTTARVAEFHSVSYDVAGCAEALRQAGLPVRAVDITDHSLGELAKGARRRAARLGGRVRPLVRRGP